MPEGLLRGDSSGNVRTERHWLVLPLSIAGHIVAALAMIIIPLTAAVELPTPYRTINAFMPVANVRPLEIPAPRGNSPTPPRGAPVTAPASISNADDMLVPSGGSDVIPNAPPGIPTGAIGGPGALDSIVTGALPVPPAAPPRAERVPVPVGGIISAPRKTVHVSPVYPEIAREAHIGGTVILEAVINERGDVERLKVLRSVSLLDGAAIEAVSRWKYTPTTLNNVPVPVLMTITVTFTLRD